MTSLYDIFNRCNIPQELAIHILEYSGERIPDHIIKLIPKLAIFNEYNNINKRWRDNNINLYGFPYTFIVEQCCSEPENSICILSKCTCCPRHQHNRPSLTNRIDVDLPVNEESLYEDKQIRNHYRCMCPCRHYSRWICRAFDI